MSRTTCSHGKLLEECCPQCVLDAELREAFREHAEEAAVRRLEQTFQPHRLTSTAGEPQ